MKKLAIAGASLALAAMPVVGVFAVDDLQVVDTIQLTINSTCSFNTHSSASSTDTSYSASVLNGEEATFSPATHKFNVSCNDNDGWKVTATPTALTGTTVSTTIPFVASADYTNSGSTGMWSADVVVGAGAATITPFGTSATVIATKTASTNDADFTVTYKAYVGTTTPADVYTGTMTYDLAQLP